MNNQKIENLLNLSLETTPEEREKSVSLEEGFDAENDTWEVIVKYVGNLEERLREFPEVMAEYLLGGFAILTIPAEQVDSVAGLWEISYMEKPKRLYFEVVQGMAASCMTPLRAPGFNLYGSHVLLAVIDTGIDIFHPEFRRSDGSTKIRALWDQTLGQVFDAEEINAALSGNEQGSDVEESRDASGHGTHVAGIASAVAPESELLIVKLGQQRQNSYPRTTELMRAVNFCVGEALAAQMPVAINLSFGNSYGSHSGTELLELFLDEISGIGRSTIVVGTGNEGAAAGHTDGLLQNSVTQTVQLGVGAFQPGFSLQIWKAYGDMFTLEVRNPSQMYRVTLEPFMGAVRYPMGQTALLVYYGEPNPFSVYQEIFVEFLPRDAYVEPGIWELLLTPYQIQDGRFDMWLPVQEGLSEGTAFLNPTVDVTLTIPSTAAQVISVGAYDAHNDTVAIFSGQGYTRSTNQVKPDLVAPGVDIRSAAPGGGYQIRSGTSMATPFVTGSAALLMEWGIVRENDPYLYGEKVKAYLIKGARRLPGFEKVPNPQVGWGALCVRNSLPV